MNGEEIVKEMAARYLSARSYQDTGVVQTVSSAEDPQVEQVNSFKTFFARPNKLRFEWEEVKPLGHSEFNIVWSDGKDTFSYTVFPWVEKEEDLGLGIAGATGISRGAAHTIPTLLMSEQSGFRLTEMDRLLLLREEQFEGEDCYVIQGFHPFGFPIEMWISKKDFLLRRTRERNNDGTWDEEIRRDVHINLDIPAEVFEYQPPSVPERLFTCLSPILVPGIIALYLLATILRTTRKRL